MSKGGYSSFLRYFSGLAFTLAALLCACPAEAGVYRKIFGGSCESVAPTVAAREYFSKYSGCEYNETNVALVANERFNLGLSDTQDILEAAAAEVLLDGYSKNDLEIAERRARILKPIAEDLNQSCAGQKHLSKTRDILLGQSVSQPVDVDGNPITDFVDQILELEKNRNLGYRTDPSRDTDNAIKKLFEVYEEQSETFHYQKEELFAAVKEAARNAVQLVPFTGSDDVSRMQNYRAQRETFRSILEPRIQKLVQDGLKKHYEQVKTNLTNSRTFRKRFDQGTLEADEKTEFLEKHFLDSNNTADQNLGLDLLYGYDRDASGAIKRVYQSENTSLIKGACLLEESHYNKRAVGSFRAAGEIAVTTAITVGIEGVTAGAGTPIVAPLVAAQYARYARMGYGAILIGRGTMSTVENISKQSKVCPALKEEHEKWLSEQYAKSQEAHLLLEALTQSCVDADHSNVPPEIRARAQALEECGSKIAMRMGESVVDGVLSSMGMSSIAAELRMFKSLAPVAAKVATINKVYGYTKAGVSVGGAAVACIEGDESCIEAAGYAAVSLLDVAQTRYSERASKAAANKKERDVRFDSIKSKELTEIRKKLTLKQAEAIDAAAKIGKDKEGPYSLAEYKEIITLLKNAKFSEEQRRALIETGVVTDVKRQSQSKKDSQDKLLSQAEKSMPAKTLLTGDAKAVDEEEIKLLYGERAAFEKHLEQRGLYNDQNKVAYDSAFKSPPENAFIIRRENPVKKQLNDKVYAVDKKLSDVSSNRERELFLEKLMNNPRYGELKDSLYKVNGAHAIKSDYKAEDLIVIVPNEGKNGYPEQQRKLERLQKQYVELEAETMRDYEYFLKSQKIKPSSGAEYTLDKFHKDMKGIANDPKWWKNAAGFYEIRPMADIVSPDKASRYALHRASFDARMQRADYAKNARNYGSMENAAITDIYYRGHLDDLEKHRVAVIDSFDGKSTILLTGPEGQKRPSNDVLAELRNLESKSFGSKQEYLEALREAVQRRTGESMTLEQAEKIRDYNTKAALFEAPVSNTASAPAAAGTAGVGPDGKKIIVSLDFRELGVINRASTMEAAATAAQQIKKNENNSKAVATSFIAIEDGEATISQGMRDNYTKLRPIVEKYGGTISYSADDVTIILPDDPKIRAEFNREVRSAFAGKFRNSAVPSAYQKNNAPIAADDLSVLSSSADVAAKKTIQQLNDYSLKKEIGADFDVIVDFRPDGKIGGGAITFEVVVKNPEGLSPQTRGEIETRINKVIEQFNEESSKAVTIGDRAVFLPAKPDIRYTKK